MKKYIYIGFLSLVLTFVLGSNMALASTTCSLTSQTSATCSDDTDTIRLLYQEGADRTALGQATTGNPLVINETTAPMLLDPAYTTDTLWVYSFDDICVASGHTSSTADPSFCGTITQTFSLLADNTGFSGWSVPVLNGISFFGTGSGGYTASTMIGQTATAVQSTLGANGLGKILAVVGGLMLAMGIGLWIVALVKESKDDKKYKNTLK